MYVSRQYRGHVRLPKRRELQDPNHPRDAFGSHNSICWEDINSLMLRIWHCIPRLLIKVSSLCLPHFLCLSLLITSCTRTFFTGSSPVFCPSTDFQISLVLYTYKLIVCPLFVSFWCIEIPQHTPAASGWDPAWSLSQSLELHSLRTLLLICFARMPPRPLYS